jgi:hypothetical protein
MLPDPQTEPARIGQPAIRVAVAADVVLQFGAPPVGAGVRPGCVDRAGVLVAAIDEDGDLPAGEGDVGAAPYPGERQLVVDAVAKPAAVQFSPQGDLGRGVRAPLAHHTRPGRGR